MHFALQNTRMSTVTGQPTHALHGFCLKLLDLHERFPDHRMLVAFDRPEQTLRQEMAPSYKAQRPSMPLPLRPQIAAMIEACALLGASPLSAAGYEADDVIAACCRHAHDSNAFESIVVASADKDLLQLVSAGEAVADDDDAATAAGAAAAAAGATRVRVWDDTKKTELDAAAVVAKHGVRPDQMADLLALMGDTSDNVPGVPGIGPKGAAKLLVEYGSLDAVLDAAKTTMKQSKRQSALVDAEATVRKSRQLVGLRYDVPIELDVVFGTPMSFEGDEIMTFLRRWELAKVAQKVDKMRKADAAAKT